MIESSINQDLKQALLSGDKETVSILRFLKSSIQDFKVNNGLDRQSPLDDNQTIPILNKELKKITESIEVFEKAGSQERVNQSLAEAEIIKKYLPKPLNEVDIKKIVQDVIENNPGENMGSLISLSRQKIGPMADGSLIAQIVKELTV